MFFDTLLVHVSDYEPNLTKSVNEYKFEFFLNFFYCYGLICAVRSRWITSKALPDNVGLLRTNKKGKKLVFFGIYKFFGPDMWYPSVLGIQLWLYRISGYQQMIGFC